MTEGAFEDDAEGYATRAWLRVAARKAAAYLLSTAGLLLVVAADWAFGGIALQYLPWPAVAVVALWIGMELGGLAGVFGERRRHPEPKPAVVTDGERYERGVARLQKPLGPPWWLTSPARPRFWLGLGARVIYSDCLGLVIAVWTGRPAAGIAAGLAWTAWTMALGAWLPRAQASLGRVAAFGGPGGPRDTPET